MLKSEIRRKALKNRLSISDTDYQSLNKGLLNQFASLNFGTVHTIHTFLPIPGKKEPDTFMLIEWLKQNQPHIKIIVPRADFDTALLTQHEYLGGHDLRKNLYNIPEPQKGALYTGEIDLVLVPLLAFDTRGYRVGYGKGFYDRFLQHLNTQKIGLSLSSVADQIDDVHETDIRLDCCVTPEEIITF